MPQPSHTSPSFKESMRFLLDYFLHSENKKKAWLLLAGSIVSVLAFGGLGLALGLFCFPYINAAFIAKDLALLFMGVGSGFLISGAMAGFHYLANFFKNQLYIDWRSWLTKKIITQYLNNKTNYLEISRVYKTLDNPEQRIQDDIDKTIISFLDLSLGFIDNASNLVIFTVLLCLAGSSLSFMLLGINIIIPGYLVLVALLLGTTTSLMGYLVNKSLSSLSNQETKAQSDLRADLQHIKNSSEEIAIEHAEVYYKERLEKEIDELNKKSMAKTSIYNNTMAFTVFNGIAQNIIPFLAAAPLYFSELISLDVVFSVGFYFSSITRSLNWFIDSFEKITIFKTSLERVVTLQNVLDKENSNASTRKIIRSIDKTNQNLVVKNLTLKVHDNSELVIKGLNLKFKPGVHTLIQAPSGTGKSSLFKAIAGTWSSGEGEIIIPTSLESIYFLPQKPTLPDDTLRKVLSYPDADCPYSDSELIAALNAVNMGQCANQLDKLIGFKSLGEQQRIAFARILLRKPDWLFLDEATASLDEEIEEQVYSRIKELLPKTTIISIAHRSTVKRFHNNVLFFTVNDKKEVQIEEHELLAPSV